MAAGKMNKKIAPKKGKVESHKSSGSKDQASKNKKTTTVASHSKKPEKKIAPLAAKGKVSINKPGTQKATDHKKVTKAVIKPLAKPSASPAKKGVIIAKAPSKPAAPVKPTAKVAPVKIVEAKVEAKKVAKKIEEAPAAKKEIKTEPKPIVNKKELPEINSEPAKQKVVAETAKNSKKPAVQATDRNTQQDNAGAVTQLTPMRTKEVKMETKRCTEPGCEPLDSLRGYCRLCYIKNWSQIKRKELILKEGKLDQYIEELVAKYSDKHLDIVRQDLKSENAFNKTVKDLEIDEAVEDEDYESDSIDSLIGSIKKGHEDIEDAEEAY